MASIQHLKDLRQWCGQKGLDSRLKATNLVLIYFCDQNSDACECVFTEWTADLLNIHVPGSQSSPLYLLRVSLNWTFQETWLWCALWCSKVCLMQHNYFALVKKSRPASKAAPPFETWRQGYISKQGTLCYLRMLPNSWNLICHCHLTPTHNVSSLSRWGRSMGFMLQLGNENNRDNNQWATRENNRTAVSRFTANVWGYAWQEWEGAI